MDAREKAEIFDPTLRGKCSSGTHIVYFIYTINICFIVVKSPVTVPITLVEGEIRQGIANGSKGFEPK